MKKDAFDLLSHEDRERLSSQTKQYLTNKKVKFKALTYQGNKAIEEMIKAYWRARGVPVVTIVETVPGHCTTFQVRSSLRHDGYRVVF